MASNELTAYIDNIELLYEGDVTGGDEYLIVYTATSWTSATDISSATTYTKVCNTYATTLGTIDYGDGDFVFDFATNLGTDTGLTWTIDKDVFRADVNTDYSKIGTLMRGKGTKLCTGTIYSYLSDNTYTLTVATIGDTYLRSAATAGAETIYVYDNTRFGTAYGYGDFVVSLDHGDDHEVVEITATGANGACTLGAPTTKAHTAHSDVMDLGCFYATGDASTVTSFLALIDAQPGAGTTNNVFVGSEYVPLSATNGNGYSKLTDTVVKIFPLDTGRADTYNYSYPHAQDAPVSPNTHLAYPISDPDSLVALYGVREAYVNPVGIVDGDTMDKLCWNVLQSGTPNATWGRVMMPASVLPATVDIGDWVNIAEYDSSATTCYQIVGLEFDQRRGVFWIELGSTEDYYLGSINDNKGTFDLSLSSI